jgi:tetratricopeptide (TPR) repeat protein
VARRVTPDYGIDTTVEVFDLGGSRTGRSFHVQLKATDEPDVSRALRSVRFPVATVDYYRSLPLPVLVVLYHAPTKQLYAKWFHAYDPHVAARDSGPPSTTTASMGFRFVGDDIWTAATAERLDQGVQGFLAFRSPHLGLPLPLFVDPEHQEASQLAFGLRAVLEPVRDLVAVQLRPPGAGDPGVELREEGWRVTLADVASVTRDAGSRSAEATQAADVALGLAVALTRVGQPNLAAQIGRVAAPQSQVITDLDISFTLAGAMFQARRIREAVEVADALDESDNEDVRLAAAAFLMALLAARNLTDTDRALAIAAAERRIARRLARGETAYAGAESYSLAMLRKRATDGEAAIVAFDRALELEPHYAERAYYHRDRAGVLFETGRYEEAVEAYGRAITLGDRGLVEALYADALLFAGRYADAERELGRYLSEDRGPDGAEWRLKLRILPLIRAWGGDHQQRAIERSEALVESVDIAAETEIDPPLSRLQEAIRLDSCNGEAWFRMFLFEALREDSMEAAAPMALAGVVLLRSAAGAWGNALVATESASAPEDELIDLLRMAYRYEGPEFVQGLLADAERAQRLGPLLEEIAVDADEVARRAGFTMRFNSDDGEVRELVIGED